MDYLDPKKKQRHKIMLLVGYAFFGVAILFATTILVYVARGYFPDRNTGELIQNGLVFVDSKPAGADVYINGEKQRGATDVRLVIPGGNDYKIDIEKEGYNSWSRTIRLEGGSLRRITYPRLIPENLDTTATTALRANPTTVSQSVDKRWIVVNHAEIPLTPTLVDTDPNVLATQQLAIPPSLVAEPNAGVLEIVEWADDNRHFLASYTTGDVVQYILVDREDPTQSQNLSTLFGSTAFEVSLRDRKFDQYFVFNLQRGELFTANRNDGIGSDSFIDQSGIIDYRAFGRDWVVYVIESGENGLVEARMQRGGENIALRRIKTGSEYFLELAKLGNAPVIGISSNNEDRTYVYNDPEKYLRDNESANFPVANTVLRTPGIRDVIISADSSIVMSYGAENAASYEFEEELTYNFTLDRPVDENQEVLWMDGQHFTFSSGGVQYVSDFNGANIYELVDSLAISGSVYSDSVETMYTFQNSVAASGEVPALPPRLVTTSLLTPADR